MSYTRRLQDRLDVVAFAGLTLRAWGPLALAMLAAVALAVAALVSGGDWKGVAVIVTPVALLIWRTVKGEAWARWALMAACLGVGVPGVAWLLLESVTSAWDHERLSFLGASILLLFAGGFLFASDALDELTGRKKRRFTGLHWDEVARGEPGLRTWGPAEEVRTILRRRVWGNVTATATLVSASFAWAAFLVGVPWLWVTTIKQVGDGFAIAQSSRSALLSLIFLFMTLLVAGLLPVFIIGCYVLLFLAPALVALPLALPLAVAWKQPTRILVLRPFNRARISRRLRALLRREIAPLGHCYTLADADIRVPLWHRVPVILGQLSFLLFRPRKIVKPSQIPKLARAMRRRVLRNINWCLSRSKLFPVASVNDGWQACVSRLVCETDVVVMDLSGISGNILWELDLLKRTDRLSRTVFLVEEDQRAVAEDALASVTAKPPPRLLTYTEQGLRERGALMASALKALEGGEALSARPGPGGKEPRP